MATDKQLDYLYEEMSANLNLWIYHKDEKALERYHNLADYVSQIESSNTEQ